MASAYWMTLIPGGGEGRSIWEIKEDRWDYHSLKNTCSDVPWFGLFVPKINLGLSTSQVAA